MAALSKSTGPRNLVRRIMQGTDSIHAVIGPAVWQHSDGTAPKRWYLTVAVSKARGGFWCAQVGIDAEHAEGAARERQRIIAAFLSRRPIIVHSIDDELAMARLCETLWPGPEITRLRRAVEAEQAPSGTAETVPEQPRNSDRFQTVFPTVSTPLRNSQKTVETETPGTAGKTA